MPVCHPPPPCLIILRCEIAALRSMTKGLLGGLAIAHLLRLFDPILTLPCIFFRA